MTSPVEIPPLEIKLTQTDMDYIRAAAEFTPTYSAWETFLFAGIAQETIPVPFLPADLSRRRAYFKVAATSAAATLQAEGQQAAPAANTAIATIGAGVPGQTYNVQWAVELDGTPGAGDVDNFQLRLGSTTVLTSINDGAVGRYPQNSVQITIPAGGANVVVRSDGTIGTAGSIYSAQLTLTPVGPSAGYVLIGELGKVSNGQGGRIYPGQAWETHSHAAVWIAGDGVTAGLVVTLEVERDQE